MWQHVLHLGHLDAGSPLYKLPTDLIELITAAVCQNDVWFGLQNLSLDEKIDYYRGMLEHIEAFTPKYTKFNPTIPGHAEHALRLIRKALKHYEAQRKARDRLQE